MDKILWLSALFVVTSSTQILPDNIVRCYRQQPNYNGCLASSATGVFRQLNVGIPALGLPILDPLAIPNVTIPAGQNVVQFPLILQNLKFHGLSTANVSFFDINFDSKVIELVLDIPELVLECDYDLSGSLLSIPIKGAGPANLTAEKARFNIIFFLEEYEKNGDLFFRLLDTEVKKNAYLMKVALKGLKRATQILGGFGLGGPVSTVEETLDVNQLINENWEKIWADIKPQWEKLYATSFGTIFRQVVDKVPIRELFPDGTGPSGTSPSGTSPDKTLPGGTSPDGAAATGKTLSKESIADVPKCYRQQPNYKECLASSATDVFRQLGDGIPELGIPPSDPLSVPNVTIPAGKNVIQFPQVYHNLKIHGLSTANVSFFDINFNSKVIELVLNIPEVVVEFDYEFEGNLLSIPIKGIGPGNVTADTVRYNITLFLDEYEKNGDLFFKLIDTKVKADVYVMKVALKNLKRVTQPLRGLGLGGIVDTVDQVDDVNQLINDNWQKVFGDVIAGWQIFYADTFGSLFSRVIDKVPISELFPDGTGPSAASSDVRTVPDGAEPKTNEIRKESTSNIQRCYRQQPDYKACLAPAATSVFRQLNVGIPALGLPPLDPLAVPNTTVSAGQNLVQYPQRFQNMKIHGLSTANVSFFDINFDSKEIELVLNVPELFLEFDYTFEGTLLSIPIKTTGPGNVTFEGMRFNVTFFLEEYEKNGDLFFRLIETKVKMDVHLLKMALKNFVRASEVLGDSGLGQPLDLNPLINEKWQILFADIKPGLEIFYADTFGEIFSEVLGTVPIRELFPDGVGPGDEATLL